MLPATTETPSTTNEPLLEPLTREERESLQELSVQAFGLPNKWQKLLKKGELEPAKIITANGDAFDGKRLKRFTVQQVKEKMEKILSDRLKELEEAAKKAEEKVDANPNS